MDKNLVDYFIAQTNKKFEKVEQEIDARFDKVDQKLDELFVFKWKIVGGAGLASFVITVGVEMIARAWGH